jgi:hypothetical protein
MNPTKIINYNNKFTCAFSVLKSTQKMKKHKFVANAPKILQHVASTLITKFIQVRDIWKALMQHIKIEQKTLEANALKTL